MISHAYRCLYVHIPRTAGTSVERFFEQRGDAQATTERSYRFDANSPNKFAPPPPHLRAEDYVTHQLLTPEQLQSYFKFSFVRNPWDRLVSEYKHRRLPVSFDFKAFLFEHFPQPEWSDEYCHVIPQYDFLYDAAGNLTVDFVGRYESLADDFAEVCRRIGIEGETTLPHVNRSQAFHLPSGAREAAQSIKDTFSLRRRRNLHCHYSEYYDDESRHFVSELYRRDLETFGYRFA